MPRKKSERLIWWFAEYYIILPYLNQKATANQRLKIA